MAGSSEEAGPEILSADVAVLVENDDLTYDIVLIRRGGATEHGKLALPGGKKKAKDGKIVVTAQRELGEETGIRVEPDDLSHYHVLDGPGRDPRGDDRTSIVFICEPLPHQRKGMRAGDDADEIVRMPLSAVDPEEMAFDHGEVIERLQRDYC